MISKVESNVVRRWARAGVMFGATPSRKPIDLERLVIDTVAVIPSNPRLFVMTATWLAKYGVLVARHRFNKMVHESLDHDGRAILGLLIETSLEYHRTQHFAQILEACGPAQKTRPLFNVDSRTAAMSQFARSRASSLSKRWKLWTDPMAPKPEALRPSHWIMDNNPDFRFRAVFKGNVKASIIACLIEHPDAGESEAELARRCDVTRKAISEALNDLQLCGLIERSTKGRRTAVQLIGSIEMQPI